ncbi:leucine rich adaptor protein 1 isoform X2 [Clupea harengus]|uniref:Leucine rich adaptor protein 1 isoform X2 n=1 Tax=Clupea harengus TaxID=7950 RepID=A0A6P8FTU9_CLUHA|nr:leucine rich adaptor protein 1 isoform X2 [Clupea harengus]
MAAISEKGWVACGQCGAGFFICSWIVFAHLRSVDVCILQQLLAVHEGIEAVKWLLEERSTLTSRCSSLTSSQYSLADGPEAPSSWRGSWGSLHDPHDRLDNISIGSYLDTLADDMDEYGCPSSSESVLCSTPLSATETATAPPTRTGGGVGGVGGALSSGGGSPVVKQQEAPKEEVWTRNTDAGTGTAAAKDKLAQSRTLSPKTNGVLDKVLRPEGGCESARACLAEKLGKTQSPKVKPYQNGKVELDGCKHNGRMHLEYDAHWRWVQSQDDVTFL